MEVPVNINEFRNRLVASVQSVALIAERDCISNHPHVCFLPILRISTTSPTQSYTRHYNISPKWLLLWWMIYFLSLRFPQGKVTRLITRCFSVHVGKYPRFGHRHRESQEIPNGECVCGWGSEGRWRFARVVALVQGFCGNGALYGKYQILKVTNG